MSSLRHHYNAAHSLFEQSESAVHCCCFVCVFINLADQLLSGTST